jgi:hypothetical protein
MNRHPHTDNNEDPLNLSQRTQVTLPILFVVAALIAGLQIWGQSEVSVAIKRELEPVQESLQTLQSTMGAMATEIQRNRHDISILRTDVDDDRKAIAVGFQNEDRWKRADQALWCSHFALLNPGVKCPNPFATGLRDVDIDGVPSWVTPGWQTYIQKQEGKANGR